jgi:hypothetical protein
MLTDTIVSAAEEHVEELSRMIARARTVGAILEQTRLSEPVQKSQLKRGDFVVVVTENSVYCIRVLGDATYSVFGGWFDRQGLSPIRLSIAGCTWGGSVLKHDIVAARGLRLEFGNRVVTSRIREVRVIRGEDASNRPSSGLLRPAGSRELLASCYGSNPGRAIAG